MTYYIKICYGHTELSKFIRRINSKRYEIIAMTESLHKSGQSQFTIIYGG